ncbi:uncharacterized protein LOC125030879 isoform X2 [Penaeus chinensis]|uniref:uncharacterized protein LOC125030879 isoform X2 n=1 Tax=Penaeus chinensis TaxID=139456 RepID=UPI001FB7C8BC|nr:uncharacterized protein LOC125030879 isoform X2 [Penaeus chinensis]
MRRKTLWPLVLAAVLSGVLAAPESSKESDDNESPERAAASEADDKERGGVVDSSVHHRVSRQLLDGWRPTDGISALENVDDILRSTIPSLDRFQCLERVMCSMASATNLFSPESLLNPGVQSTLEQTFQQGLIQDPSLVQQGFPQGFPQQTGFPQQQVLQQGFPQQQVLQQGFPQQQVFAQGFPPQQAFPQQPAFQQPFPQQGFGPPPAGSFNPQFQPPPSQFTQTGFQQFAPFGGAAFRENQDGQPVERQGTRPQGIRRQPVRRRQRNGFLNLLSNLGLNFGKRKKRDLLSDIVSGFTGERFMGLLDRMMESYSFHPYTHAAYMGYSGNECNRLYPSCPSSAEEMIDVFNNIHRHYPNGIPFKDKMPWPLNVLLP